GVAAAIAAMSCCSPLLIPAVAALLGASGTSLLALNLRLHAWFVPMTLVALTVLLLSAALAVRDLASGCSLGPEEGAGIGASTLTGPGPEPPVTR
ncbi:MAG: hypothetical protein ACREQ5_37590, partial [Candidatus Dormibacteria bacterium]